MRFLTKAILFLALLPSPLAAQEKPGGTVTAPGARRVFTNDSLNAPTAPSAEGLPLIPGLIPCGKDLKCFLPALDKATPAAVTRSETAREGNAIVTMESTWWTSRYNGDQCTVSFRVDALDAKLNPDVVPDDPKARAAVEARLAEMKRDFENIRTKTQTCTMTVGALKAVMTSSAWSLLSLGPASAFGKNCSGPMFDSPTGPRPNGK